ncbi:UDP-glycosyltransferase [Lutibacter sp.]|uniref:UDP-glycosyltransferase n=1 Tax=Lutibacter sp. TaxID=1925666 RepID=UPI00356A65AC
MTKKILIILDSIDVNDSSGSKANVALIQNLQALGYRLKVVHYTLKEIQLNGVECVAISERKFNLMYFLSRTQRVLTRLTKININPFIEGLIGFSFTFLNDTKSIKKAILKERGFQPDLLLTLSKGGSFRPHYAVLQISELHNKWMAYVHDPYPFHCYPRPYDWVEKGAKFKEDFFRQVSEKAMHSAFPSLLLQNWMGSYFSKFLETGIVIPHQNLEVSTKENIYLPVFFEKEKFNLFHAGNLMNTRPPLFLLKAYKQFLEEVPEAKKISKLYLIGNVDFYKDKIIEIQNDVPQIYCSFKQLPYNLVSEMQKNSTVNFIIESKASISPFLPGKFPHCVAANKPIVLLSPYYSEVKRLLGKEYPYISEVDDVDRIQKIILKLYKEWIKVKDMRLNRPDLEEYISINHLGNIFNKYVFKNE